MTTYQVKARLTNTQLATLQFIALDNIRIGLEFRYSKIDGIWYLWLKQTDGTRIAGPIAVVPGNDDLFAPYHYNPAVPPGRLYVESTSGLPPDDETIDVSAVIYYEGIT